VTDWTALCAELEATWHRQIPLAAAMSIAVAGYDGKTLAVSAPLAPNRNVHGTVFAGSLFSICTLAGWGATWLALRERGLGGLIVVADCNIRYRRGVATVLCRCTPDADKLRDALDQFAAQGRATLDLVCTIDSDDKPAVTFTGKYVVQAQHA
jgi:thioesterase domain-containing protein